MNPSKIIFTVCTNNYLAQANVLAKSVKNMALDYMFYLFLADEFSPEIEYNKFENINFINWQDLPIDCEDLKKKFDVVELSTGIKASCFKYLFSKYEAEIVHYFDPDIRLFSSLNHLDAYFDQASILLTPHIFNPIKWQDGSPNENLFLRHGLYNLGYLGLKKSEAAAATLDWWEDRCLKMGFNNPKYGFFVDQLWMNYIPLFHPKETFIILDKGYNMGPWNLHERSLSGKNDSSFMVNGESNLVFYHFSSYNYKSHEISRHYRYTFASNPDVKPVYDIYQQEMIEAGVEKFELFKWAYTKKKSFLKKLLKK
ncbi:hypothetical protein [Pedobacter sp.]|uniref:hypothetical protein n=1 Tax=Pedobacter sp. TaxID=1411316 RepID=UPI00396CF309